MLVEAAAAGIQPDKFWDFTLYEIMVAIRGHGKKLLYDQLILARNIGPLLNAWAKGNHGQGLFESARKALEDHS